MAPRRNSEHRQSHSLRCAFDHRIQMVQRQGAGDVDAQLLAAIFELPVAKLAARQSQANAGMLFQLVRRAGTLARGQVGRRCDREEPHVAAERMAITSLGTDSRRRTLASNPVATISTSFPSA